MNVRSLDRSSSIVPNRRKNGQANKNTRPMLLLGVMRILLMMNNKNSISYFFDELEDVCDELGLEFEVTVPKHKKFFFFKIES
ncbi:hypothetical protein EPI10_006329 [Gossypium australe]|uniref:Uncharacterized protein n=1 Tax=Gossypium australe TaxID=47621 RepID=A0A5B6WSX6_9ROSI|nr:hypothetical protein EPI10_006329 [Gossypium australe]